ASINVMTGNVTSLSTFTTFQLAGSSVPSTYFDKVTRKIAVLAFPDSSGTTLELVEMDLATNAVSHVALAPGVSPLALDDAEAVSPLPLFPPWVMLTLGAVLAVCAVLRLRS